MKKKFDVFIQTTVEIEVAPDEGYSRFLAMNKVIEYKILNEKLNSVDFTVYEAEEIFYE